MGIISDAQLIGKALQEAGKIELYQKLIEIQEKIIETQQENHELREIVGKLENEQKLRGALRFENNAYYLYGEPGEKPIGPFCSGCRDASGKLIHMHSEDSGSGEPFFRCPNCKHIVWKDRGRGPR
jgi:hypothetical protein